MLDVYLPAPTQCKRKEQEIKRTCDEDVTESVLIQGITINRFFLGRERPSGDVYWGVEWCFSVRGVSETCLGDVGGVWAMSGKCIDKSMCFGNV